MFPAAACFRRVDYPTRRPCRRRQPCADRRCHVNSQPRGDPRPRSKSLHRRRGFARAGMVNGRTPPLFPGATRKPVAPWTRIPTEGKPTDFASQPPVRDRSLRNCGRTEQPPGRVSGSMRVRDASRVLSYADAVGEAQGGIEMLAQLGVAQVSAPLVDTANSESAPERGVIAFQSGGRGLLEPGIGFRGAPARQASVQIAKIRAHDGMSRLECGSPSSR